MSEFELSQSEVSSPKVCSAPVSPLGSPRLTVRPKRRSAWRTRGGVAVRKHRRRDNVIAIPALLHEEATDARGGAKMREFLKDAGVNPYDVRLPFSAKQVGIYHEVLLAGTEEIEKRRKLLRVMEEHGTGPFGGPANPRSREYIDLGNYIKKRLEARKRYRIENLDNLESYHIPDYRPVKSLLEGGDKVLERCPTPPPSRKLFSAIFELEESPWCGLMGSIHGDRAHDEYLTDEDLDISDDEWEREVDDPVEKLIPTFPRGGTPSLLDLSAKTSPGVQLSDFTEKDALMRCDLYTKPLVNFALEVQESVHRAQVSEDVRERIRQRTYQVEKIDEQHEWEGYHPAMLLPELPFRLNERLKDPLTTPDEESFLYRTAWFPSAEKIPNLDSLGIPLTEAWERGKRGSYGRYTKYPTCQGTGFFDLRWFIVDGTEDEMFLTIYDKPEVDLRHYRTPNKVASISSLSLRNAYWDVTHCSISVHHANEMSEFIQDITPIFFQALLICIRNIEYQRKLYQLRRIRFYERRYEMEEAYLRGLRNLVLYKKILLKIDDEQIRSRSRDPLEQNRLRMAEDRSGIRFKPVAPPERIERQFYGLGGAQPKSLNDGIVRLIDHKSPNGKLWTRS